MALGATVFQLNISRGGVPKLPVREAVVEELGLEGDGHNAPKIHGGPERAVCLFALERIEALRAEGHSIGPGTTGENVTTQGLDWDGVVPGMRLRLGDTCVLEVTRFTAPCKTIAGNFADRDFDRMSEKTHPGWSRLYARVITPGVVRPGDTISMVAS